MNSKVKNRVGEKHITTQGFEIEIIESFNKKDNTVRFKDGTIVYNKWYSTIKKGNIRHPYYPTVRGVGIIGSGDFSVKENNKITKVYATWASMLNRSYSEDYKEKYPTYKDVTVCEEWKYFQNFGEWFINNHVDGFELDKDILQKGNKTYSPETCCFVPKEINYLLTKTNGKRGKYPIGVQKQSNYFLARISVDGISKHIGSYSTPEEAFQAYKTAKEKHIKEVAEKYKNQITKEVYEALYNYQVEITD